MAQENTPGTEDIMRKINLKEGRPLDYNPLESLKSTNYISPVPAKPILYNKDITGNMNTGPNPVYKNPDFDLDEKGNPKLNSNDYDEYLDQSIEHAYQSSLNPTKLLRPYTFNGDYDGANFERYYSHSNYNKLGFSPYRNNEDLYNKHSTFGNELSRASGQWLNIMGSSFVSAGKFWTDMGSNLPGTTDVKGAAALDRAMAIGSSSKGGFTGFATNTFMNSGLSIGVGMEWLLEEAALTGLIGLSGGLAAPAALPMMGASATRLGRGLSKIPGIGKMYERGSTLGGTLKKLENIENARTFWNGTSRAGKVANSLVNIVNPLSNTMEAVRGVKFANSQYKALHAVNTFGGFAKDFIRAKAVVAESNLEGGLVKLDIIKNLTDEYKKTHDGVAPQGKDLENIYKTAEANGVTTSLWNLPIIMVSNSFLHETLFKHIKPRYTPIAGEIVRKEAGAVVALEKQGYKVYDTWGARQIAKGKALLKPRTHFKYLGAYMKANVAEGLQENFQEAFSAAAINHAMDLYQNEYRSSTEAFSTHVSNGLKAQFSPQGLETFASGLLMGAISQPITSLPFATYRTLKDWTWDRKAATEYRTERAKQLKETVESWNKTFKDPRKVFAPEIRNMSAQTKIHADYLEAVTNGNVKNQIDAKRDAETEAIMSALFSGNYNVFLNQFKEGYEKLNDQELIDSFNKDRDENTPKLTIEEAPIIREKMQAIQARAEKVKSRFDYVQDNLSNPYNYNEYPAGTEAYEAMKMAHIGWQEMQKALVLGWSTLDSNIGRVNSMKNDLGSISKPLEKMSHHSLTLLLNPETRMTEVRMLREEIKALSESTDPAVKEEVKKKEELLDILERFHDKYTLAENTDMYDDVAFKETIAKLEQDNNPIPESLEDVKRDEDGNLENGIQVQINEDTDQIPTFAFSVGEGVYELYQVQYDEEGNVILNEQGLPELEPIGEFQESEIIPLTKKGIRENYRLSHTAEMKQLFVEYLNHYAKNNNDLMLNSKVEQAFQTMMDFMHTNKETVNLTKHINYLADPVNMAEQTARFVKAYKSQEAQMRKKNIDLIDALIKKYELNEGLKVLYQKGFYITPQYITQLQRALRKNEKAPVPESFINVATGDVIEKDTPKYKEALKIWEAQLEAITDSFKKQMEAEAKAEEEKKTKHRIVENSNGTFTVMSPEGKQVGEPFKTRAEAEDIAAELDIILAEEKKKTQQDPKAPFTVALGDTDWWDKHKGNKEIDALKVLITNALAERLTKTPEELSREEILNFLRESTTAFEIINTWNAEQVAKKSKQSKIQVPILKVAVAPPGKTLEEMSIEELTNYSKQLVEFNKQEPNKDLEADIQAIERYTNLRKGEAITKPSTKAQEDALNKVKAIQDEVINKRVEGKAYLIDGNAYGRVTRAVTDIMKAEYGYNFTPFSESSTGQAFLKLAEESLKENKNVDQFMEVLNQLSIDGTVYGQFNDTKLRLIRIKLKKDGFTIENLKKLIDENAYSHTTRRGNRVDKHIRSFFKNYTLGERPKYFRKEAWENLETILKGIRNTFEEKGLVIVADDLTLWDKDARIAGTLDLLVVDKDGNYYIYDIKTGDKEKKWDKYEKPIDPMPNSSAMAENSFQLSLYQNLLENQTGIKAKGLAIFGIETKDDLNGNILSINAARGTNQAPKGIRLTYDNGIVPSPTQKVVPINVKAPVTSVAPVTPKVEIKTPEVKEVTVIAEKATEQIKYLNEYLKGLKIVGAQFKATLQDVDSRLAEQDFVVKSLEKELSDLEIFLDRASPKELKGKKKKIKDQIKNLKSSIESSTTALRWLEQEKIGVVDQIEKLEALSNTANDALKEVRAKEVSEALTMHQYLVDTLDDIKYAHEYLLLEMDEKIENVENSIIALKDMLRSLGVADDIITMSLDGVDITEGLKSKIKEIKLKYFGTTNPKEIDKYKGKIASDYAAEVAPYQQQLIKNKNKDFKANYRSAIKTIKQKQKYISVLQEKKEKKRQYFYEEKWFIDKVKESVDLLNKALIPIDKANKAAVDKQKAAPKKEGEKPTVIIPKSTISLDEARAKYLNKSFEVIQKNNTYKITSVETNEKDEIKIKYIREGDDSFTVLEASLKQFEGNIKNGKVKIVASVELAATVVPTTDTKADIKIRSKKSSNSIRFNYSTDSGYYGIYYKPDGTEEVIEGSTRDNVAKKINAKYDAELAALGQTTINNNQTDIEKEVLGSFSNTTERVVNSKGPSNGRTIKTELTSKVSSDGEVIVFKSKNTFTDNGDSVITSPASMTIEEFKEHFYPMLTAEEIEMFEETLEVYKEEGWNGKIYFKELRVGSSKATNLKGQLDLDIMIGMGNDYGFTLTKKLNDAELAALEGKAPEAKVEVKTPTEVVLSDDHVDKVKDGSKTITNRKEDSALPSGTYKVKKYNTATKKYEDTVDEVILTNIGLATVETTGPQSEVRLEGNHVVILSESGIDSTFDENTNQTIIEADNYARAEGYNDWEDFKVRNKYSKNFVNGNQSRVIHLIKSTKPIIPEEKTSKQLTKAQENELLSKGFPYEIQENMSSEDVELALELDPIGDMELIYELIEKYKDPIIKDGITLGDAIRLLDQTDRNYYEIESKKQWIDQQLMLNDDNISIEEREQIDVYYQKLYDDAFINPIAESLEKDTIVLIENIPYVVVAKRNNIITFTQLGTNISINIPFLNVSKTVDSIHTIPNKKEIVTIKKEEIPELKTEDIDNLQTSIKNAKEATGGAMELLKKAKEEAGKEENPLDNVKPNC